VVYESSRPPVPANASQPPGLPGTDHQTRPDLTTHAKPRGDVLCAAVDCFFARRARPPTIPSRTAHTIHRPTARQTDRPSVRGCVLLPINVDDKTSHRHDFVAAVVAADSNPPVDCSPAPESAAGLGILHPHNPRPSDIIVDR
jgi:hypothetical protein